MSRVNHRPSPAMVIAMIALFAALGGTGYATTQLKRGDPTARSVEKTTHHARRGPRGRRGLRGPEGPQGPRGLPGPSGAAGTALGYAKVNIDGTVEVSESKGVTSANVVKTGPGGASYCFHGLPFTPNSAAATIAWNRSGYNSQTFVAMAAELPATTGCPADTQVMVGTGQGTSATPEPFYVIFT